MTPSSVSNKPGKGPFPVFAQATATAAGGAPAFMIAIGLVVLWAATGPLFHFSDVWQMVINTGTTIVTFLMIFVIQNAQNRDGRLVQLKLDELIRAVETAETAYIAMDEMCEADLDTLRQEFTAIAAEAKATVVPLQPPARQTSLKAAKVKALVAAARE